MNPASSTTTSRVVVIGAGMGGLAVATRLAFAGHRVTVVEQADSHGGKLARHERDGFVFDTGPSLLTLPAVYRDLFLNTARSKRDARLEDNVDLIELDPAFGYRFGDGTSVVLPGVGPTRVADALQGALGGTAGADWRRLIERATAMWSVTRTPFVESSAPGLGTLLRLGRRVGDVRTVAPWSTLRGLGRATLSDPRLVTLLDRYATYSGSDPRQAPAVLATIPYIEQNFGAWHIGGGLAVLADAVRARAEKLGVDFRFGTGVERVLMSAGRASGVALADGTELPADLVVSDADASHLYGSMVDDPRVAAPRRRLAKAEPSLSGFVMLLGVRGRTPGIQHHNVWFPTDYDAEFESIFGRRPSPVDDPTIYACVPDDPAMRPDGDHESWFILVNAPRHGDGSAGSRTVDWNAAGLAEQYADRVLAVLAERGVDLRDRIAFRELRTPADLESRTLSPGGAIYGSSSNGSRAAFLRPDNRSPVPGLFLVGGSAHPGGGLPLVGLSAATVAELIGPA